MLIVCTKPWHWSEYKWANSGVGSSHHRGWGYCTAFVRDIKTHFILLSYNIKNVKILQYQHCKMKHLWVPAKITNKSIKWEYNKNFIHYPPSKTLKDHYWEVFQSAQLFYGIQYNWSTSLRCIHSKPYVNKFSTTLILCCVYEWLRNLLLSPIYGDPNDFFFLSKKWLIKAVWVAHGCLYQTQIVQLQFVYIFVFVYLYL